MVNDAEKFKADDEKQKDRISAKNGLESYCFNMKTTIEDEKVKDKISDDDKKKISEKCEEAIKWLDANQLAEVDEFNEKQKEVEAVCSPLKIIELARFSLSRNSLRCDKTSSLEIASPPLSTREEFTGLPPEQKPDFF